MTEEEKTRAVVTVGLRMVRDEVEKGYELDDEQRLILHDIVTKVLGETTSIPAGAAEWDGAIRELRLARQSLVHWVGRSPEVMQLLAATSMQIGQYEQGNRSQELAWQVMGSIRKFRALQTKLRKGEEDNATEGPKGRHHRRRR